MINKQPIYIERSVRYSFGIYLLGAYLSENIPSLGSFALTAFRWILSSLLFGRNHLNSSQYWAVIDNYLKSGQIEKLFPQHRIQRSYLRFITTLNVLAQGAFQVKLECR